MTRGLALVLAVAGFALVATANSGGYRYGVSDQAFYVPAIVLEAHPDRFPRDRALLEPQMHLWLGGQIVAATARAVGDDLPTLFAVIYFMTLIALALAAIALGRSFGADWRTVALFLVLLTLRHRIAKTGANSLEGYAHPRMLAFAAGLAALAAIAAGRQVRAAALAALSIVIHTTTGAWFALILILAALWPFRQRRWPYVAAGTVGVATAGAIVFVWPSLLTRMDPVWLGVLADKDYLFPAEWPAYAWIVNLAYPVVLGLIYRARRARGITSPGEAGLVAGLIGLVILFLISVPLAQARIAIVVQLQINRVFWLIDAVVMLYVAWWAVDLAQRRAVRTRSGPLAVWALVAVVSAIAVARGVYVVHLEARRPLVQIRPARDGWMDAMHWIEAQPTSWHVLADPGHAWKYGLSVRVAAERDTLLETGKDTAIAMYDRGVALRVADRIHALAGFDTMTTADIRALDAAYALDVFVARADRPFDLPVLYRNPDFVVYDLR